MAAKQIFLTIGATLVGMSVLGAIGASAFVWSGAYNVAATEPHAMLIHWILETGRTRSIQAHAVAIAVPPERATEANLAAGTEHYAAHCAICHGAPGVPRGDIAHGLYPPPPDLKHVTARYTPAQLFWILKNGIKSTGMPAWNDHADGELWATVSFMEQLPAMSEQDYAKLVMQTIMTGGQASHSH